MIMLILEKRDGQAILMDSVIQEYGRLDMDTRRRGQQVVDGIV